MESQNHHSNNILDKQTFNFFQLEAWDEQGKHHAKRLPLEAYLQIVAASNLKQRLRMTTLYYHAERRNWAVIGTGNKDEHMQGFFVKYGDGGTDLKPIAHLFKVQVFQLAEAIGVPREILGRTPTTDTYSAEQTQEEFCLRPGLLSYGYALVCHGAQCPAGRSRQSAGYHGRTGRTRLRQYPAEDHRNRIPADAPAGDKRVSRHGGRPLPEPARPGTGCRAKRLRDH